MSPKRSSRWMAALPVAVLAAAFGIAWVVPRGAQAEVAERSADAALGHTESTASSAAEGRLPRRGFLGVHVLELTPELRRHLGVPGDHGVLVSRVLPGSPAEEAGIEVGDVLAAVDAAPVGSAAGLRRALGPRGASTAVELEVYRDGRLLILSPVLAERQAVGVHRDLRRHESEQGWAEPFVGEEWELFAQRMAELGERIGLMGMELGEEVGRRLAEELGPALERLIEPELRWRLEEGLRRWEEEGLPKLEESLRELEQRVRELE
jgi:hypothetical protein